MSAASGSTASTPAPREVRSATSRSPCRDALSVSVGSTNVTSPLAARYHGASTRWRLAWRTASTEGRCREYTIQPRTFACAMPARSREPSCLRRARSPPPAVPPDRATRRARRRRSPRARSPAAPGAGARPGQLERATNTVRAAGEQRRRAERRDVCGRGCGLGAATAGRREQRRRDEDERGPHSPVGRRPINEASSSSSGMPSSTAQTPSVIGSSTPSRRERSRSTGAVVSPSTTWPICAFASSADAPARDQLAGAAVAPGRMPAGDDQVAHAGQPGEGLRVGAERLTEPGHLGQAARDERRLRVVAEPEPVDAARRRARSRSSPPRRARRRSGRC